MVDTRQDSSGNLRRSKGAWRRAFRARLGELSMEERAASASAIRRRVLASPEITGAGAILVCLSFGVEPDTWSLVEALLEDDRELFVPRASRRDAPLTLHRFPCPLETLSFGLQQPRDTVPPLAEERIDSRLGAALIVGLGFDESGCRLGYGAGHFDRLLTGRPFPTFGLAFEAQVVPSLPREPHDVRLSGLITERRRLRFDS